MSEVSELIGRLTSIKLLHQSLLSLRTQMRHVHSAEPFPRLVSLFCIREHIIAPESRRDISRVLLPIHSWHLSIGFNVRAH